MQEDVLVVLKVESINLSSSESINLSSSESIYLLKKFESKISV